MKNCFLRKASNQLISHQELSFIYHVGLNQTQNVLFEVNSSIANLTVIC